jgi:hypothetical protein
LLNLDLRDFEFWHKEARKKLLLDKAQAWQASRMGQVENATFSHQMNLLQWELKLLDKGAAQVLEGR